jgi:hypothetical protein
MNFQEQQAEALRLYKTSNPKNIEISFENYKNVSKNYVEILNSQDKSVNPFLKDKNFVLEEYRLENLSTKENLEKITEYSSFILMDFIKIKESNYICEGFYKRLKWRTTMLNYYIWEWIRSRVKKEVSNGGIGEDITFPEESERDYDDLENKKLSTLRKIHVNARKIKDTSILKYEIKLQLLAEKYQKMVELYPYEDDL